METFTKKHINLSELSTMKDILRQAGLHTVCESALCPNIGECFCRGTATFMIAGNICTRNCSFCAVNNGRPLPLDPDEPARVAQTILNLKLKYAVITSVTRDDLDDGAAQHFANTVTRIKQLSPKTKIEILVPDFQGKKEAAISVFMSYPHVFNHNLETVPRLYLVIRRHADYERSLELLKRAKEWGLKTKSGLMLGLGEKKDEIIKVMKDLQKVGCDIITFGQYLPPSKNHYPVKEHLFQSQFDEYRNIAFEFGFTKCFSAPYVRSSYMADTI